jgi:spermidine/putrescine transport system substrate-binding protein
MNRRLFLMSVTGAAGCSPRRAHRLNVFNWSQYVAPETIPDFEREFDVRVRYVTYESAEEMLAKVSAGNSGFDVVFPSNSYIEPLRDSGLLAPLRHERLSNLTNLESRFQSPPWDPGLRWCVPYMHGTNGIVYDSAVQPPPNGWADFWTDRFERRVTMLDDPSEVIGACLIRLGCPLNSTDPGELSRARSAAISAKRLLRAYINAEVKDQLVAGDILMAQLWATAAQFAIDARPALRFVHPAEGFAVYADNATILRESGRVELAHEFTNYLLRPRVAARIASTTRTATANAAALQYLPEAMRQNGTLYPPEHVLARGQWFTALPPAAQRYRDRIWTEIKSA